MPTREDRTMPDDHEGEFNAAEAAAEFAAAMAGNAPPEDAGTEATPSEAAPPEDPPPEDPHNFTAILEEEVEALGRMLAERDEALQAAQAKAAAAGAEIDRVRARLEREAAATIDRRHRAVLVSFLDVADDLDRAVHGLVSAGAAPAVAQGVQMALDKLQTVLIQHGARRRPALGLPFDPAHHEAVSTIPATDDAPAGSVAAVLQEGYEIGEQPLRIARVVVAQPG